MQRHDVRCTAEEMTDSVVRLFGAEFRAEAPQYIDDGDLAHTYGWEMFVDTLRGEMDAVEWWKDV